MKKEIVIMLAAVAMVAGCKQRETTTVSEPSGASREEMRSTTNQVTTNQLNEPAGASRSSGTLQQGSSTGSTSSQSGATSGTGSQQSGTQSNP